MLLQLVMHWSCILLQTGIQKLALKSGFFRT